MKRMSLKNEIGNILESSAYLKESRTEWGEEISIYQAESGNFKCSFAVSEKYPIEDAVEDLKKRAERMFRKKSEKMDGGLKRQKEMVNLINHSHLLQDLVDVRYQHLTNGYSIEKAMRLIFDYKRELPEGVTCFTRHAGNGKFINVYSIPGLNVHEAMEILPLLPPKYLYGLEM